MEEERLLASLKVESVRPLLYHEHCVHCLLLKQDQQHRLKILGKVTTTKSARIYIQIGGFVHQFAVGSYLLFSPRCTVVPALLAEEMPTIVEGEMEVVQVIRDLVVPLAFPVPLGWDTVVPTALEAVEEVLEEQGARHSPWRTSSLSMQHMQPRDQCT